MVEVVSKSMVTGEALPDSRCCFPKSGWMYVVICHDCPQVITGDVDPTVAVVGVDSRHAEEVKMKVKMRCSRHSSASSTETKAQSLPHMA